MRVVLLSHAAEAVAGSVAAAIVSVAARRQGALTRTGMIAAAALGAGAAVAGWEWAVLLLAFFLSSTAWSRVAADTKLARTAGRVAKPGPRDAAQVFANGGLFAAGALLTVVTPGALVAAASIGALASAAGDSWATEIGGVSSATPRSIISRRPVPPGTSGGVTIAGTLGGCAGAAAIAGVAILVRFDLNIAAAAGVGGIAGMLADSLLGGSVQAQRRCDRCGETTEQIVHACGGATRHERGWAWLDSDGVNALATAAGAMVAAGVHAVGRAA